jgi:hypothetical protein
VKLEPIAPAREFEIGSVTISHCADIELDPDEQITFVTASGTQFDVARKSWGYYATPSLNSRLPAHGLRPALTVNPQNKIALLLVESGCEEQFSVYLSANGIRVVAWLDSDNAAAQVVARLERP